MPDRRSPAAELPPRSEQPTRDAREGLADRTTWKSGPERGAPRGEGARELGDGRYVVHEEIARGGMGRVVAATDQVLGRVVAVKEALITDPDTVRRFARETEITARLEHPAIVPVYDAGFDAEGLPYYVMRKVSGQPLDRLVESTGTLAERLALLPHVVSAAEAVAHAHRRAVLHRDLKPANILVGEFGETVVIDWGLAKVTDEVDDPRVDPLPASVGHALTHAGAVFGTPGFMSPEQLAGEPLDPRGDVYALGATLYFLLAKRPPHDAESGPAMMALAAAGPPAPIAALVPGVPRDLAWIIDTALAFDPADRYPHAGALAAELKDFLTGQLVASRHYTPREHLVRFVRRHRIAVIAVAAAAIVLGFAVTRVLAERATARGALATALREKQQADEALVEMTLSQARALLASNPTAAAAVVRPLAGGPRWREVRAIAAAARHAGACVGLPGPLQPLVLALSPGGARAASVDLDGTIWLHDLEGRASRALIRLAPRQARFAFAGDDRLVVYDARRLAVVELASGAARELPHQLALRGVVATPTAAFVTTEDGRLHRVALDGSGSAALDVREVTAARPSPDGRRLAVETAAGLVLLDLAGGAPPVRIGDRPAGDARWEGTSASLSVRLGDELVVVAMAPSPAIRERRAARGHRSHLPLPGRLATHDEAGVLEGLGPAPEDRTQLPADFPIAATRGDALVVGRRSGSITLLHRHLYLELRAPSDDLRQLAASPASPYVLAATAGRVLVWRAEALLPELTPVPLTEQLYAIGPRRLLLATILGEWRWHDLDTGLQVPFRIPPGPYAPLSDGRDLVVLTHDVSARRGGFLLARPGQPAVPVELDASALAIAGGRITLGTPGGEVLALDPATRQTTPLAARPGQGVTELGAGGGWLSARWADGAVWRRGPDGREARGTLGAGPSKVSLLLQLLDGRACTCAGRRLVCWNADGSITALPELPFEIQRADLLAAGRAIVTLADGGVYRIDLATGAATSIAAAGGISPALAHGPELGVANRADNKLVVIDLAANATWPLVGGFRGGKTSARISSDGEIIAIVAGMRSLLTWRLRLPPTPEATARWLDELTNATLEHGTTKVGWR